MDSNSCNFEDLAGVLEKKAKDRFRVEKQVLAEIGVIVKNKAKDMIGHEQPEFPPLSPVTKDDRVAHGYPENEPLLRDGYLKKSIGYNVKCGVREKSVMIGYKTGYPCDSYAKAQEEGDGYIPARPLLKASYLREYKHIKFITSILGRVFNTPLRKEYSSNG